LGWNRWPTILEVNYLCGPSEGLVWYSFFLEGVRCLYVPHVFRKALSITPHFVLLRCLLRSTSMYINCTKEGGKGQNETSQNMFLIWERTMFRLLCYGTPPYSKHISVVASSYGYFWDFYIKKITSAPALGRRGGGFLFFVYSLSVLKLFLDMFPIAPPFNPIFFSPWFKFYTYKLWKGCPEEAWQSLLLFWGRETYLCFYVRAVLSSKNVCDGSITWFLFFS